MEFEHKLRTKFTDADVYVGTKYAILTFNRDTKLTYDDLLFMSETCNTKKIDIRYGAGWLGTEITPGDPASFEIVITY